MSDDDRRFRQISIGSYLTVTMAATVPKLINNSMQSFKSLRNFRSFTENKNMTSFMRLSTFRSFRERLIRGRRIEWRCVGVSHSLTDDFQYICLRLDWFRLWAVVLGAYCGYALLFAMLTWRLLVSDTDHFAGEMLPTMSLLEQSFWLSMGHLISIGYGHLQPVSCTANILVTIQFFLGIVLSAVLLGVVVTKASLPSVKLMFSDCCLITMRNGVRNFMFRVANTRGNLLVAPDIRLSCFTHVVTQEGESVWVAQELAVDVPPVLAPSFNFVHKITESSPLREFSNEELKQRNYSISLVATDNHTFQTLYATKFYAGDNEVLCDVKFADILKREGDTRVIDFRKFNVVESYHPRQKEEEKSQ